MISFICANCILSALFAKRQPAFFAISIGSNGRDIFPSGVVFVFAHIGVVGLACQVVSA
jgi:hypothetical protein